MTVGVVRLTNIRLQISQKVYAKKTQSKMCDLFIVFAEGLDHAGLVFLVVAGGIVLSTLQFFK